MEGASVTAEAAGKSAAPRRAARTRLTADSPDELRERNPVTGPAPAGRGTAMGGLGQRLRAERTRAGMSLRQLARSLDVSASFVSQIETGKSKPSVATLYQICQVLSLPIEELFAEDAEDSESAAGPQAPDAGTPRSLAAPAGRAHLALHTDGVPARPGPASRSPVVSPDERLKLVFDSGVIWEKLSGANGEPTVDFLFVRYNPGGSSTVNGQVTRHAGVEYGYVLSGVLDVSLGFETYQVGPHQSISFDSSQPHRLVNNGTEPVEAVWFVHGRDASHSH